MRLEELNRKYCQKLEQTEELSGSILEQQESPKYKKRTAILLVMLLFLLCGAAIIAIPRFWGKDGESEGAENIEGEIMPGLPDGMNDGEIAEALQQMIDESMFTISVNTRPVFQNGRARGKINIVNAPQNHYPCKVALILDEDESVLYKNNDLLYPEQYIPEIRLNQNLRKGVYDATLAYTIYEEDGESLAGMMNAKVQIVIQN